MFIIVVAAGEKLFQCLEVLVQINLWRLAESRSLNRLCVVCEQSPE